MPKQLQKFALFAVLLLIFVSIVLGIWMPITQSFRIIFGAFYLLFVPGFVWSWIFWKYFEMDLFERSIISLVLSIAIVPLTVFLLNKIGVRINLINSILEIAFAIILGVIILLLQKKFGSDK